MTGFTRKRPAGIIWAAAIILRFRLNSNRGAEEIAESKRESALARLVEGMSLYLGIDSGTQSAKALVLDLDTGRIRARASAAHRLIEGLPPGHLEQNPQDWVAAMDAVIEAVASKIDRRRVRGIGISGQQHGLVALDGAGSVIRPAKLWSDTSTVEECRILTKKLAGRRPAARLVSRLPFLPGYTAPKILWLKRHEPANYRRLRHVLLPHDYLNFHLTGNYFMEQGDASGTALMDIRKRAWARDVVDAIDRNLADWLPPISPSSKPAGALRPLLAKRYGFPDEVVVSAGGGDNMMAAIGTGNVRPGIVTASFGTSGTIYAFSRKPVLDSGGEIAGFCSSSGGWLPLICTMNVTLVTEQFRSLFNADHAGFERSAAGVPPGADGLILVPYFDGERTPNLPHGTGGAPRSESPDAQSRPSRARGDRGGDLGHELRLPTSGAIWNRGERNSGYRGRRKIRGLAADNGRCLRPAGRDGSRE